MKIDPEDYEPDVEPVDDETDDGCGYSWDHTVAPGENTCRECGAELDDDEDDLR